MVNVQLLTSWQAHEGAVYTMGRTAENDLISGGADRLLRRWDPEAREQVRQWGPFEGAPFALRIIGSDVMAGLFKAGLVVIDATAPQLLAYWDKRISVFAISTPYRGSVWIGMSQGYLMQWDVQEHQPQQVFQMGKDSWRSVAVIDDMIWTGNSRGTLAVIAPDGRLLAHWQAHQGAIFSILPEEGEGILTAGADGYIRRWETTTLPAALRQEKTAHNRPIHVLIPWNTLLLSGAQDKSIKIWQPASLEAVRTIHPGFSPEAHRFSVNALVPLDAERFASAGEDRTIKIWHLPPSHPKRFFPRSPGM